MKKTIGVGCRRHRVLKVLAIMAKGVVRRPKNVCPMPVVIPSIILTSHLPEEFSNKCLKKAAITPCVAVKAAIRKICMISRVIKLTTQSFPHLLQTR